MSHVLRVGENVRVFRARSNAQQWCVDPRRVVAWSLELADVVLEVDRKAWKEGHLVSGKAAGVVVQVGSSGTELEVPDEAVEVDYVRATGTFRVGGRFVPAATRLARAWCTRDGRMWGELADDDAEASAVEEDLAAA